MTNTHRRTCDTLLQIRVLVAVRYETRLHIPFAIDHFPSERPASVNSRLGWGAPIGRLGIKNPFFGRARQTSI